ncbi:hypothetical protein PASE110613_03055 [Paenibacillus sediminis]|uniref:Peptidoglycan hydrolase CwlO-like protein n=1 Tax=Paenibacillus sediminis TaxID=664909 RepID=A0ABS4GYU4_9BACL|nr:hypothetical protein [Paenibacillus sediminis]MBP1935433.1 peptidoglycan hydrolase CwlO-like protein [Paenibacillus sediminis]
MHPQIRAKYCRYAVMMILLITSICSIRTVQAESPSDQTHGILQDSLSITEIDHEIERIEQEQIQLKSKQDMLNDQLAVKQNEIGTYQKQAGTVLRAYYMGQRESLLSILFTAHNLDELYTLLDYMQLLMEHDQNVLAKYKQEYTELTKTKEQLAATSAELSTSRSNLLKQRERIVLLQQGLDQKIAASSDPEKMKQLIEQLTTYWNNTGFKEVERYFQALDAAMEDFPEFIQKNNQSIIIKGNKYSIEIKDDDLNAYLRSKNELFTHFALQFEDGKMLASGRQDNLELTLEGHYTVEEKPENSILYHVDKLIFNGYELPDTTRASLESKFDLAFYPGQVISFLKATDVELKEGILKVTLQLTL